LRQTVKNPDSHLSQGPKPTFTSRYADPNHPASSGDLIALVTGGKVTSETLSSMKGQGLGRGRQFNTRQSNVFNRDINSNQPAPHASYGGRSGLKEIIENVRELRSSQVSTQMPTRGRFESDNTDRRFEGLVSLRDNKNSGGPLIPIGKLLKKVREMRSLDEYITNNTAASFIFGHCQYAIRRRIGPRTRSTRPNMILTRAGDYLL
jgi:hypothetical protein